MEIRASCSNSCSFNTNTHKACFWMLSYALFEPGLLELIRTETAAAFVKDSLDFHYLERSCPRLQGLWLEVLRVECRRFAAGAGVFLWGFVLARKAVTS